MLDFSELSPEENAERLFDGPGPSSLHAAATAWTTLACELDEVRSGLTDVLLPLIEAWQSPAATQMTQAVMPYQNWLHYVAGITRHAAHWIGGVADAYDHARRMMVPPATVRANIDAQKQLHQTNPLEHNTERLMSLVQEYHQFWGQNAWVMHTYANQVSAALSWLTPFEEAPAIIKDKEESAVAELAAGSTSGINKRKAEDLETYTSGVQDGPQKRARQGF